MSDRNGALDAAVEAGAAALYGIQRNELAPDTWMVLFNAEDGETRASFRKKAAAVLRDARRAYAEALTDE